MSNDPKPVCTINGEPWWDFLYEYEFDGGTYSFHVCARSRNEADARMKKIAMARYRGQACGGPIAVWHGWAWVPLLTWWKGAFR